MAAVLVALYEAHTDAEQVRNRLVHEGFPTDRVKLTSRQEPGQAAAVPADSGSEQFHRYFRSLFDDAQLVRRADSLAERVAQGAAAVTVHPRGDEEIAQARQILESGSPLELGREHLDDTLMEHPRSAHERPYLARVLLGSRAD